MSLSGRFGVCFGDRNRGRLRRRFLARRQNISDLDLGVRLAMAAQPSIVLPSTKMLDVNLGRGMFDDLGHNARPVDRRLTDVKRLAGRVEQNSVELDSGGGIDFAVVHLHLVAFAYLVLP